MAKLKFAQTWAQKEDMATKHGPVDNKQSTATSGERAIDTVTTYGDDCTIE